MSNSPKQLLKDWNLKPKHPFGQNFLLHSDLSGKVAERVVQGQGGTVIEIGAGLGALTTALLKRAARVVAIERDRDLIPLLRQVFEEDLKNGRLTIVEGDAKTTDYAALFANSPLPRLIAGNLPYQLTGPLLRRTIELAGSIERAVFMVQLEVADRLCAAPGARCYGALSVFAQACYSIERAFVVGRTAFYPSPKVNSAVIEMTPLTPSIADETPLFRELVKLAFRHRRKTLRNAWRQLSQFTEPLLGAAAARCGVDLNLRGEMLSVHEFSGMAKELSV